MRGPSANRLPFLRDTIIPGLFCTAMIAGLIFSLAGGIWSKTADFTMFYASGLLLRDSPAELYDAEKQAGAESLATGVDIRTDSPAFTPFGYPPVTALLFVPFTWLKYKTAYYLLAAVNAIAFAAALHILAARLRL